MSISRHDQTSEDNREYLTAEDFRQILREDGVPGLFRGLTATFTREMPGYFFFFLAYEATRGLLAAPGQ